MSTSVVNPFQIIPDLNGKPLDSGYVYIGQYGLNPEASPVAVYWDEALTIPAALPLRTRGGYIVRNGTPARVYTAGEDYSILVRDKNSTLVWSSLTSTGVQHYTDAEEVTYIPAGTGAVATTVQAQLRNIQGWSVNVQDAPFYAVADDTTSCTAAFQAAIDTVLAAGGGKIYIPAGTYWFPAGTKLDPGVGGITFVGDGPDSTILHYNEGTTLPQYDGTEHLFRNIADTAKNTLVFDNLQIRGTLDTREGRWANPLFLDFYPSIQIRNCKFYNIAGVAMDLHKNDHVLVDGCKFENIAGDAIRARDTPNCIITNNHILRTGDDSIAIHTSDAYTPSREGIIVSENRLVNCGAIKLLGGRVAQIINNTLELPNLWGIVVSNDNGNDEGNLSLRDVTISGNTILDAVSISSGTPATTTVGIEVTGIVPRGVASTDSTIPGMYNSTTGEFIYPWDYDEIVVDTATNPVGFIHGISITNNIIRRSRPAVSAFSDYGHGTRLWQGVSYDPAITDAHLKLNTGIVIGGGYRGLLVTHNIIESCNVGMAFVAGTFNRQYENTLVKSNLLYDCSTRGVLVNSSSFTQDITIEDNYINCDPYRQNSNSNIDGTYDADSTPKGIDIGDVDGVNVVGNKFANVCKSIATNDITKQILKENVLSCQPVATVVGFTNTNKGIGVLEYGSNFSYEIVDADPTSATYMVTQNTQLAASSAMPSTGIYVKGAFVSNSAPTIDANDMTILGWLRLTTGSGHVSGTDWAVIRGSHVSPAT